MTIIPTMKASNPMSAEARMPSNCISGSPLRNRIPLTRALIHTMALTAVNLVKIERTSRGVELVDRSLLSADVDGMFMPEKCGAISRVRRSDPAENAISSVCVDAGYATAPTLGHTSGGSSVSVMLQRRCGIPARPERHTAGLPRDIDFSGHPQSFLLDSHFHITTSVAGGSLFLMKPVKMRPIAPLIFLPELFLSRAFADEPFPELLLAKSFADQLDPCFTE